MAKQKETYYVAVKTYWLGAPTWWFGPHKSRSAAEDELSASSIVRHDLDCPARDMRYQTRCIGIFSNTESKSQGRCWKNTFNAPIPGNESELNAITGIYFS